MRRASNGIPPRNGASDEEKVVHDLWARAAQRTDVRVTVDVIAGTSVGGLNGVLLAAAIARGASLADFKQLWLDPNNILYGTRLNTSPPSPTRTGGRGTGCGPA